MTHLWQIVYSFVAIPLLWLVLQGLGLLDAKVRRAIAGRRGLLQEMERTMAALPPGRRVWIHSSSMGEFEQAKPIIAALKSRFPGVRVVVTFYSPSGYENSRKYQLADAIFYLPFDTRRNAGRFLDIVRPDVAVIVRYDIWPNHIWELRRRSIPTIIANATMRRQTERKLPLARNFHRHLYNCIDTILTVSRSDAEAFGYFRLTRPRVEPIGDTRYDQVVQRSAQARTQRILPAPVLEGKRVFVAGSTWPEDEEMILPPFAQLCREIPDLLLILVPHEPTLAHLEDLEADLRGGLSHIRFSSLNEYNGERIIIVDSIGILLALYSSAHVAFIGGSFKQNVHNVLEAAVFGIPVLFGPRYRNSQEALMLVDRGGAFIVTTHEQITRALHNLLTDETARSTAGSRATRFVQSNTGATDRVIAHLAPYLDGSPS
jgi:3-deoxy-D-manno-octulosonic-acid transferase